MVKGFLNLCLVATSKAVSYEWRKYHQHDLFARTCVQDYKSQVDDVVAV
jgi:hypothetical protein